MSNRLYAVALIGRDRPGIVAEASGLLLRLGCNVEDGVTSLLSGHFALMLVCSAPAGLSLPDLRASLARLGEDLHADAWAVDERLDRSVPTHVLNVYGPDRRGIVHRVASLLAERRVNISDMTCRLAGSLYTLSLEVELPGGLDAHALEGALQEALTPMGLELTLGPIDSEVI